MKKRNSSLEKSTRITRMEVDYEFISFDFVLGDQEVSIFGEIFEFF